MTEMLFILTTVFVAYVVYVMVNEQKETAKNAAAQSQPAAEKHEEPAAPQATATAEAASKEAQTVIAQPAKPSKPAAPKAEKPTAKAKAAGKPKPAPAKAATSADNSMIRNPATGETASATGNYLFSKRWIKEALVSEGLLDKVYKNNEVDSETSQKIKDAQAKLAGMDKYKA